MRLQVIFAVLLPLAAIAENTKKPSTRIKEIAPVFRRNPYRSSTTPTTTESVVTTSEAIEVIEDEQPSIGNYLTSFLENLFTF